MAVQETRVLPELTHAEWCLDGSRCGVCVRLGLDRDKDLVGLAARRSFVEEMELLVLQVGGSSIVSAPADLLLRHGDHPDPEWRDLFRLASLERLPLPELEYHEIDLLVVPHRAHRAKYMRKAGRRPGRPPGPCPTCGAYDEGAQGATKMHLTVPEGCLAVTEAEPVPPRTDIPLRTLVPKSDFSKIGEDWRDYKGRFCVRELDADTVACENYFVAAWGMGMLKVAW